MNIAFLYAGQGSQAVGMGSSLYEQNETFKKAFNKLPENLKNLAFNGPIEDLSKTSNTQPIMVAFANGVTDVLKENGIMPKMAAGLSLGEYSALYCADVLNSSDAIEIVTFRGKEMEKASVGLSTKMAAVLMLPREVLAECVNEAKTEGIVEIANYNCPGQLVIAGEAKAVEKASALALEKGAKRCIELNVSGPFHTSFMKPAGDALATKFAEYTFSPMSIPVIFNSLGKEKEAETSVQNLLERQVQSSVYFEDSIRYMIDNGIDTFIEIGPGKVLSGFIKKIDKAVTCVAIEDMDTLNKAIELVKGE